MKIQVKEWTTVRPTELMLDTCLWLSNLDQLNPINFYVRTCYFYRINGADNFFDSMVLKPALGRAMVDFYPVAGRVRKGNKDRVEIDCNGEGGLFVEAEADAMMDDLGDFGNPSSDLTFIPTVDRSQDVSTLPLFVVQVTRFKCGGVCLGIAYQHILSDGLSALHFINSWSEIARGLEITTPPFLDRQAVLSARNPPQTYFAHIEYQTPPKVNIHQDNINPPSIYKIFKLTLHQINSLKANFGGNEIVKYSTFEVVAGHLWRCVSIARQLPKDQETKLCIPIDGRTRLQPSLPEGYFGSAIFHAVVIASAGELQFSPLKSSVQKIHEAIARMDNDYLRSTIDYLELQDDIRSISQSIYAKASLNLVINNWSRLPFYGADFGWGKPIYVGFGMTPIEGRIFVLPSHPTNDENMLYGISLPEEHMDHFERLFYDI